MENRPLFPLALYLVNEAREREHRARGPSPAGAEPASSIVRLAVGQSIVRVGARLAGEPTTELARSR